MQQLTSKKPRNTSPEDSVTRLLGEARMVLPGIQALLGFQLVAVFNQGFHQISAIDQQLHGIAIFFSVNAICLLLTPAALDRQSTSEKPNHFVKRSSLLIRLGMTQLMLSIVLNSYVVFNVILHSVLISCIAAIILLSELAFCWIIWPHMRCQAHRQTTPEC